MGFTPSNAEMTVDIQAEDNASGAINGITGSLSNMRKAGAAAGGALAAIGIGGMAKATSAAVDFEEAMKDVEKVSSAETADALSDDVQRIAENTRLAHGEVAELASQAARFGAEGEEEIANFTETASKMGAATTLSSDEAGRALAKMSNALGVPLSDVEKLGDATNELSNNYAANSQEIVDSATRSGQALQAMGMNEDQILGLSAAMNEVAPSSSKAGTMMRKVSEAMMDPKRVGALSDALGVSEEQFKKMREESPTETMREIGEVMAEGGEKATMLSSELSKRQVRAFRRVGSQADTLGETYDTAGTAMEEGGSLARENSIDMNTLAGQMEKLSDKLTTAAQKIGKQFIPVLLDAVEGVMPLIDAFITLNDKTDGMAGVAILAGTAISGLAIAIGSLAPVITGTVVPALGAMASALAPVLAPIAAIVAAVGAMVYAWENDLGGIKTAVMDFVDTVKSSFEDSEDTIESLKDTFDRVVEGLEKALKVAKKALKKVITGFVVPLIEDLADLWETHFADIAKETAATMNHIMDVIEDAMAVVMDIWDSHGKEIMDVVTYVFDSIRLTIVTTMDVILSTIRVVLALIRGDFDGAFEIIEGLVTRTFNRIVDFIKGSFIDGIKAALSLMVEAIKAPFVWIYNFLIGNSLIPEMFNAIVDFINNKFISKVESIFKGLKKFFTKIWNKIFNFFKGIWTKIFNKTKNILSKTFNFYKNILTKIFTKGKEILKKVFNYYKTIWKDIFNTVKSKIKNVHSTIKSVLNKVKSTVKSVLGKVINKFKNVFGKVKSEVASALSNAYNTVKSKLKEIKNYLKNKGSSLIKGGVESVIGAAKSAFNYLIGTGDDTLLGDIKGIIQDLVSYIKNTGKNLIRDAYDEVVDEIREAFDVTIDGPEIDFKGFRRDPLMTMENARQREAEIIREEAYNLEEDEPIWANAVEGVQDLIPGFADGGVVTAPTMGMIGEAGETEAVMPLDELTNMIDMSYQTGTTNGTQSVEVSLNVEGDDELTRLIRDNAEVVVEENDKTKRDRLQRF